ncbi:hypothetical protein QAD02_001098 [Eretmocerus hayati]|uniref:Uncharacterized protein n=1 Tax=Eretmocerus hayati TaxID=131215 RepID=A0ACC2NFH4_9HYME|nr:hypothetical protein QAD02_001098 [Eretmocerus hayati]
MNYNHKFATSGSLAASLGTLKNWNLESWMQTPSAGGLGLNVSAMPVQCNPVQFKPLHATITAWSESSLKSQTRHHIYTQVKLSYRESQECGDVIYICIWHLHGVCGGLMEGVELILRFLGASWAKEQWWWRGTRPAARAAATAIKLFESIIPAANEKILKPVVCGPSPLLEFVERNNKTSIVHHHIVRSGPICRVHQVPV